MTVEKMVHPDTTKRLLDKFNTALGQKLAGTGLRVSFGETPDGRYVYRAEKGGYIISQIVVQIIGLQASWSIS